MPSAARLMLTVGLSLTIMVVGMFFVFAGPKSCSSTEGSLVSKGEPLGSFTLTPTSCRSGEHESFFGVYLLPEGSNQGGIKIVKDPSEGYRVYIEKPGSCRGEECEVVEVDKESCDKFNARVVGTNTYVNEIRLLDGSLTLDCKGERSERRSRRRSRRGSAPTVRAKITFESCD